MIVNDSYSFVQLVTPDHGPAGSHTKDEIMTNTRTNFEQQVLELDAQRYRLMEAADAAGLEPLLDEELAYTHSSGHSDTKAEYLDAIRRGVFVYANVHHAVLSVVAGGSIAAIRGELEADAVIHGVAKKLRGATLAVWRDSPGGPRLVALQSTSLPPLQA